MSFVSRILAGARELPFGGPLGALLERAARHVASWYPWSDGEGQTDDPRQRIAFTIAVIALGAMLNFQLFGDFAGHWLSRAFAVFPNHA